MKENKFLKRLYGGYIAPRDNTRVAVLPIVRKFKLSPLLREVLRRRKLKLILEKNLSYVYDTNKAKYYRNMLNFYNNNAFGNGISGRLTEYDYTTPEGLKATQSNFNYAKDNASNFIMDLAGAGATGIVSSVGRKVAKVYTRATKGVFKSPSKNGALGTLKQYSKNPIGGGAEAVVVNNTPTTVGKMTSIPVEEMTVRNSIPNTVPSKYIGYVKDRGTKLPTYVLKKLKVLTDLTFPRYVLKLDKSMEKSGFKRVNDPNVQYRAYTNGSVVVDDVSPGNVGLDWLRRPKMIDFNLLTVPEWLALGFRLKRGGKL